ncbi:DUF4393 domain-containing protein [Brumimicrobium glaciale]|uniref:DUF4393 domain-containing protein n=1 Tax=Brumimicrobium glaciale TaxID=200475 RepID=A0A4Q4KU13_9FLAO|nr:Abi-alpha family protein [Brumimicrobium glaciale]RYM35604.1 DUF4393 domain-containing protein [Brumimicrobium glaciale]
MDEKIVTEIAKSIPDSAWNRLVQTACDTFEKAVAPLTESTSGIGRLIKAKFDRLLNEEKVLVAETFAKAKQKITESSKEMKGHHNLNIVLQVVQESCKQTDEKLRDLWANLLATELTEGGVHPEIVSILKRISSDDARVLLKVSENSPKINQKFIETLGHAFSGMSPVTIYRSKEDSFSEKLLERLGLIKKEIPHWKLTEIGIGFLEVVSGISSSDEEISNDQFPTHRE